MQISYNLCNQSFEIPSTHYYTSLEQDLAIKYAKKKISKFFFLFAIKMVVPSGFNRKRPWDFEG